MNQQKWSNIDPPLFALELSTKEVGPPLGSLLLFLAIYVYFQKLTTNLDYIIGLQYY